MKKKLIALSVFSCVAMVGCNKQPKEPELGKIEIKEENKKETPDIVDNKTMELPVNSSIENKEKPFFDSGTINDGGYIEGDEFLYIENENIESYISSELSMLYKKNNGEVYALDLMTMKNTKVSDNEDAYKPYKIGSDNTYVLSINGDSANYRVITPNGKIDINTDKELIMADAKNAYLFDEGSLYRYSFETLTESKMTVTLNGSEVVIKDAFDRYDNDSMVLHVGSEAYIVRLVDAQNDDLALQPASKVQADDIEKIIRDNRRNDSGKFLYRSTDGNLKVYDKNLNKVRIELPDITKDSGITAKDSCVFYGGDESDDYIIYFTDYYKTFRYTSGDKELVEVKQEPTERFQDYYSGLTTLKDGKIKFIFLSYGDDLD